MEPGQFDYNYFGQTVLNPLGLVAVIVLGVAMLLVPRRYAPLPMIMMACFIAPAQRVVVFTLNFDLLRVMVIFGMARVLLREEWRDFVWKPIDKVFLLWGIYGSITYVIIYGTFDALKYRLGMIYAAFGMYFLFRMVVKTQQDIVAVVKSFSLVSIPVAVAFVVERITGRNAFAIFGGVPELTGIRQGVLRCQGAYAHPILAGCFWASLMPLMAAQWWRNWQGRALAIIGVISALVVVVLCASSTPVMSLVFGLAAACIYPLRHWMRAIRWGIVVLLIGLHFSMNAPVWFLLGKLDFGGSTGHQRVALIDNAVKHANEWWMIGSSRGTEHWGWNMSDVTNMYLIQGLEGGVALLICFILMFVYAFQGLGLKRKHDESFREDTTMTWAMGIALFMHGMNFLAIAYFGQINMLWYMTLAIIGSITPSPRMTREGWGINILPEIPQVRNERGNPQMAEIVPCQ